VLGLGRESQCVGGAVHVSVLTFIFLILGAVILALAAVPPLDDDWMNDPNYPDEIDE
jgi:hypothetical protein